jgi:hypothetical protein
MNPIKSSLILAAGLALCPALYAADAPPTDTITVVEEGSTPDAVVRTIALPEKASATAVEKSTKGLETANAARELRGNATAAEAREQGREFGQRTAEQARQSNPSAQMREAAKEAATQAGANRSAGRPPVTPPKP